MWIQTATAAETATATAAQVKYIGSSPVTQIQAFFLKKCLTKLSKQLRLQLSQQQKLPCKIMMGYSGSSAIIALKRNIDAAIFKKQPWNMYLYTFRRRDISFSIVQMKQKQTYSMTASTTFINKNFQKEKGYMTYDLFLACSQKHNM